MLIANATEKEREREREDALLASIDGFCGRVKERPVTYGAFLDGSSKCLFDTHSELRRENLIKDGGEKGEKGRKLFSSAAAFPFVSCGKNEYPFHIMHRARVRAGIQKCRGSILILVTLVTLVTRERAKFASGKGNLRLCSQ